MNANLPASACDPQRLGSFLSGDLSGAEEREFTLHLNDCESCRNALAEEAAEPAVWREAAELLRPSETAVGDPARVGSDAGSIRHEQNSLQIQNVLDALRPTDDPERLGRLGGYEISGVVGAGGMGVVLKASDQSLDRTVAIKVLAPHLASSGAARKRFAREAKAAAAVLHPNVIAIHSVSNDEALPYLVMPYVRGTSLQKRLDREGPLSLQEILRIGAQIAAGLAAAHAQGLVHRDIKPANILLEEGIERVTITDFGLARAADDATITHSGMIAGTPQFMSPEQARGEAVDPRSDLFSLGSVLYAICTGRPPFRAETSYGVMRRITDDEPRPIREINPDIPAWLCQLIAKLMAKQAADRYQSAAEVAELLEACLAHVQQPTVAKLPPALLPAASGSRFFSISRRSGVLAMLAAFGLGLLGLLAWQATEAPDIAGNWSGEDWGQVVLKKTADGEYSGTYTDTFKERPGTIELKWSRLERRYKGDWREGQNRSGKISLRLVDDEIRGAWTTSKKSQINPGTPELADLTWKRSQRSGEEPRTDKEWLQTTPAKLPADQLLARMQGAWIVERMTNGLEDSLSEVVDRRCELMVDGTLLTFRFHGVKSPEAEQRVEMSLKWQKKDDPNGVEVTLDPNGDADRFPGLIQCEGDLLRLCFRNETGSTERPRVMASGRAVFYHQCRRKETARQLSKGGDASQPRFDDDAVVADPAAAANALPNGLKFLAPYKQLHKLSLDITEKEFLAIVESERLKVSKSAARGKTTYSIPTGDGHTVIVMFSDDSEKCRGIQRLRGEEGVPDAANNPLQFSEPKEIVLSAGTSKFMLDFDTDKTMDMPATVGRPEEKGMDVLTDQVQPYHYPKELIGRGLQGVEVKASDWDASAEEVRRILAGDKVEPLKQMDLGPEKHPTCFFQTSDGARGILQLLEVVEEPKGIRLRYKTISGALLTPKQVSFPPVETGSSEAAPSAE